MEDKIVKSTIIYTVLGLLPLSFALVFTPVYLRYLNPEQYGILNLFSIYSGILVNVYTLGVNSAFGFIYWDYYKDKKKVHHLLASTLGLILILQLIIFTVGLIFGNTILNFILTSPEIFPFYPFGVLTLTYPIFAVFYELFFYYYRNESKIKSYAILNIGALVLLTVGSILGILVFNLKAEGAILGRTAGYAIIITSFLIHLIFKVGVKFELKISKKLLKFGIPLMLTTIIGGITYSVDRIMVERFSSIKELGIYGLAIVIVSTIEIWFNALNNSLSPTIFKNMKDGVNKNENKIHTLSHLIVMSVLLASTILIMIAKPVIELIAPKEYYEAIIYVPILSIAFAGRVFSNLKSYIFYLNKTTKILPIIQIISLVVTVFGIFLLHEHIGLYGIPFALLIVKNLEILVVNIFANRVQRFSFKFRNLYILWIITICSVLIMSNFSFQFESNWIYCIPFITLVIFAPIVTKSEISEVYKLIVKKNS